MITILWSIVHTRARTALLFWNLKFYTGSTVLLGRNSREGTLRDCLKFRRRECPGERPRYLTCRTKMLTVWLVEDKTLWPIREERWSDREPGPPRSFYRDWSVRDIFLSFFLSKRCDVLLPTEQYQQNALEWNLRCFGWRQAFLLLLTRRELRARHDGGGRLISFD